MIIDLGQAAIDRLQAQVPALAGVDGALELADLLGRNILPQRFPSAFVLPIGEDAEANVVATGLLRQRVVETIGVLIVHKHAGDAAGGKTREALEPLKTAVQDALAGWQPADGYGVMELVRSRLVGIAGGAGFLQVDFRVDRYLRRQTS